jgi:hypothetical protein
MGTKVSGNIPVELGRDLWAGDSQFLDMIQPYTHIGFTAEVRHDGKMWVIPISLTNRKSGWQLTIDKGGAIGEPVLCSLIKAGE